jgi:hypothetical protein
VRKAWISPESVGQVWSWHGSWSAQAGGKTYYGLKSRKLAIERVERIHELSTNSNLDAV